MSSDESCLQSNLTVALMTSLRSLCIFHQPKQLEWHEEPCMRSYLAPGYVLGTKTTTSLSLIGRDRLCKASRSNRMHYALLACLRCTYQPRPSVQLYGRPQLHYKLSTFLKHNRSTQPSHRQDPSPLLTSYFTSCPKSLPFIIQVK